MRKQIVGIVVVLAAACGGSPSAPGGSGTPPASGRTVTAIGVSAAELPFEVGKKTQLAAFAIYPDRSTGPIAGQVTWVSASPDLATVDAHGVALGVKHGEALIQAKVGDLVGDLSATVVGRPVKVTVHVASFDCIADCDDALNGDGDFVYSVEVQSEGADSRAVVYETSGFPAASGQFKLGAGKQRTIDKSETFSLRDQPEQGIYILFEAAEWDTFGRDNRLAGASGTAAFVWKDEAGWGTGPGRHTITLGSGGCVVRLTYDLSFVYTN